MCNSCNPNLKNDPLEFDTAVKSNMVSIKNPNAVQFVKADKDDVMSNQNAYDLSQRAPSSYNGMQSPNDANLVKELEAALEQNKQQSEEEKGQQKKEL